MITQSQQIGIIDKYHKRLDKAINTAVQLVKPTMIRYQNAILKSLQTGNSLADIQELTRKRLSNLFAQSMTVSHLYGIQGSYEIYDVHLGNKTLSASLAKRIDEFVFAGSPFKTVIRFPVYERAIKLFPELLGLSENEILAILARYTSDSEIVIAKLLLGVDRQVNEAVAKAVAEGLHGKAGIQYVRERIINSGISIKPYLIETLLRTQMQLAFSAGSKSVDETPAIREILWGYKYVTAHDDRVRPNHLAMDGVKLPKDDAFWSTNFPPNGYNCRCIAIKIFDRPRNVIHPYDKVIDGVKIKPQSDEGFDFDPSVIFRTILPIRK